MQNACFSYIWTVIFIGILNNVNIVIKVSFQQFVLSLAITNKTGRLRGLSSPSCVWFWQSAILANICIGQKSSFNTCSESRVANLMVSLGQRSWTRRTTHVLWKKKKTIIYYFCNFFFNYLGVSTNTKMTARWRSGRPIKILRTLYSHQCCAR